MASVGVRWHLSTSSVSHALKPELGCGDTRHGQKLEYAPEMERASSRTLRIAAVGDLHVSKTSQGKFQPLFSQISDAADVLLLCGDFTDYGMPEEARILSRELNAAVKIPVIAVLGVLTNGLMIYGLGWTNWARLLGWLALGMIFYFGYGRSHSRLESA